jgi:hypothetical protein
LLARIVGKIFEPANSVTYSPDFAGKRDLFGRERLDEAALEFHVVT